MISIRRFFASLVTCLVAASVIGMAGVTAAQEAQEGRMLLFPDIYKDKIAFVYGGDLWLAPGAEARRSASLRVRDGNCFRSFRRMESGWHSPGNTMAISTCM